MIYLNFQLFSSLYASFNLEKGSYLYASNDNESKEMTNFSLAIWNFLSVLVVRFYIILFLA